MRQPGGAPSYEKIADQIKTQAREKQMDVHEQADKTEEGIEHMQQRANSIRQAIGSVKAKITQIRQQMAQDPNAANHPGVQKQLKAYQEQLGKYQDALKQTEAQIEKFRGRRTMLRNALVQIAANAAKQLGQVRQQFDARKKQQATAQQQQKQKGAKAESGKVRG